MIIKGRWRAEVAAQLYALHCEIQGKSCTSFGTSGTCNNKDGGTWVVMHSFQRVQWYILNEMRAQTVIF